MRSRTVIARKLKPISGKPTITTTDEFIAFASRLREQGATLVKLGAMEVKFPPVREPVSDEDEPSGKFRVLAELDESEQAELQNLRRMRDQSEELD